MPKISVVIPCYNRAGLIARAVASAVAQSHLPHEVIVVDDGSTDGSAGVAAGLPGPVRVLRQANAGAAAARNAGIATATGDWVAFLDSDDEWHSDKLRLQLDAAARFPDAQLVFCDTLVRTASTILMPSRFALGGIYGKETDRDGEFIRFDRQQFITMLSNSRVITSPSWHAARRRCISQSTSGVRRIGHCGSTSPRSTRLLPSIAF